MPQPLGASLTHSSKIPSEARATDIYSDTMRWLLRCSIHTVGLVQSKWYQ